MTAEVFHNLKAVLKAKGYSTEAPALGAALNISEAEVEALMERRRNSIDIASLSGNTVTFGATVTLVDEDTEEKLTYQLVGELEADVKEGRLAVTAPLARAIIGKEVGDTVEVNTPKGEKAYEILKVKFI